MADARFSVRAFESADAPAFAALNKHWIEAYFGIEAEDLRQLERPQESILDPGGYIAIAAHGERVVGTGALTVPHHPPRGGRRWMEVVKMATSPQAQGQGVGRAILEHLINIARQRGAHALWLETNDRLEAAIALYRKTGFHPLAGNELWETPYARCNLQMALVL